MLPLPIGDYPNPPRPQWVTRILIGINVAVFLFVSMPLDRPLTQDDLRDADVRAAVAEMQQVYRVPVQQMSRYDVFTWKWGYQPGRPSFLALIFCMFLHGGFLHLAGNMLYLWIFGDNVEYRLGPIGYLVAYLATGCAATLSFGLFEPDSLVPLVGASGAISGVLGFYLIWFPHNRIRLLLWIFFFIHVFHVPAVFVLLFYVFIDNLLPFFAERGGGGGAGIAYAAHLGGFAAGVLAAFLLDRIRGRIAAPRPGPQAGPTFGGAWGSRPGWGAPPPVDRAAPADGKRPVPHRVVVDPGQVFATAIEHTRMEEAVEAFARLLREGGTPPQPGHVFTLGRWLYAHDYVADAAAVFRYYVRNFPRGDDLDRVHLGLGVLLSRRMGQPAPAREHLLQAAELTDDAQVRETARGELARIDGA